MTERASSRSVFSLGSWPFFKGGEIMIGFYNVNL
jgi:hypothetical protein